MNTKNLSGIIKSAKRVDKVMTGIMYAVGGFFLVLLIVMAGYIIIKGILDFNPKFLAFDADGIGNQFFNTIYLVFLSLLISVPIGIGAGIYLAEYAGDNKLTTAIRISIESLSSLPSIVVGLFGMLTFVLTFHWGFSILSGALALTMFNIPILVRVIQQALEAVPRDQRDAALALGLTRWEATVHVLVPAAMPAIVTGVILSAGRVFGEAAALIYTAGQSAPALSWTAPITSLANPLNVFRPAETLAVHIWKINSEGVVPDLTAVSAGTAAVLMVCILAFNIIARIAGRALERRLTAE